MITAAHALLSSDRIASEEELILTTCQEALAEKPCSLAAIHRIVNDTWPGANIPVQRIAAALERARTLGLVATMQTLDGTDWALTAAGRVEIDSTANWYTDTISRLTEQIQERATQDFGRVPRSQAELWASTIVSIFTKAISSEASLYEGGVNQTRRDSVRPVTLDSRKMLDEIQQMNLSAENQEFLGGCLLASIDEADPFGNELVNYAATSCILHSLIAGRAGAQARRSLGSLTGERIVLDTPVLVECLGPEVNARRVNTVIDLAIQAGMEVIVPEHVIHELLDVITRVESEYIPGLMAALRDGVGARIYAGTVSEQVLELFLDATESRRFKSWEEFATHARSLKEDLTAAGVVVREHGNYNRPKVDEYARALKEEVEKSTNHRGHKQIARDAETMELVSRARRRKSGQSTSLWPGGWVVSRDRKMSTAYQDAERDDLESLVLTPSQWATLVSESTAAPEVAELISAAASYLRQEAVLRIAVKYPPDIALSLARSLSSEAVSDTDVRVAQLTLVDLLDELDPATSPSGETIASAVASKRSRRIATAGQVQRQAFDASIQRMSEGATRVAGELDQASRARKEMENQLASERQLTALSQEEATQLRETQKKYVALGTRRATRVAVLVLAILTIGLFAVLQLVGFAVGTLIGTLIFNMQARKWAASKDVSTASLFGAFIPEVLGVFDIVARW
jgi:predicted nucleic acid-binding protein